VLTGVGCIVDGVPPRMQLTEEEIQVQLDRRRPGQAGAGAISTGRNEADAVQILSGNPPSFPVFPKIARTYICIETEPSCVLKHAHAHMHP
jgi:hypothetical protein